MQRKTCRELGPAAGGIVACVDLTSVQFHEIANERQPNAKSTRRPGWRRVFLGEAIEDARQESRVDARAAVRHSQNSFALDPLNGDTDGAATRRELHRIGEQVPDD